MTGLRERYENNPVPVRLARPWCRLCSLWIGSEYWL